MEVRAGPGSPKQVSLSAALLPHAHLEQSAPERVASWVQLAESAHAGVARLLLDEPPADNPADAGQAPVQVAEQLVREIDAARREIWLISAYLIPTPEIEAAIQRAEERGVEVRILTNSINSNNHITAHSAYRKHIRNLLEIGVDLHEVRFDAEDRDLYIESPVENKSLCLHAKVLLFDDNRVFIGSANLDPRSMHINTEMGLMIESESLNAGVREALEPDFSPRNAWQLKLQADGRVIWVSGSETVEHQPTHSFMRRIEDWFFSLMPIENEM
jgi:putative cardiolipin synthase